MFPSRRRFVSSSLRVTVGLLAARASVWGATPTSRERVIRALDGRDVDRPPLTLWHHFGLESKGPSAHADATLAFHRAYGTDLVKVMSDVPFPLRPERRHAGRAHAPAARLPLVLNPIDRGHGSIPRLHTHVRMN